MNETETKLLETLRKMRELTNKEIHRDIAATYLAEAISVIAEDTIYAELALKIIAQYVGIFEPGAVT